MKTVVTDRDNIKHRILTYKIDKYVFVLTFCDIVVALISGPCPNTPGHLIAMPFCKKHTEPIKCETCYA